MFKKSILGVLICQNENKIVLYANKVEPGKLDIFNEVIKDSSLLNGNVGVYTKFGIVRDLIQY